MFAKQEPFQFLDYALIVYSLLVFCVFVGSLLETPYPFSPGTSPEPASSVTLIAGLENKCCSSVLDLSYGNNEIDSSNTTNTANATTFSSKQYTSTTEDVLNHELTPKSGPSSIAAGTSTLHSFVSVKVTEVLSHCSQSITADAESTSFSGLETTNWEHSYPLTSGTTEITSNHEPFHLVGFLEQLAKRGDDTHLPQYLHQVTCLNYTKTTLCCVPLTFSLVFFKNLCILCSYMLFN